MDIAKDISNITRTLIAREPLWGLFLIAIDKNIEDLSIPLAGVGKPIAGGYFTLLINPDTWVDLTFDEKIDTLKHELCHIAYDHFGLHNSHLDLKTLNIAQDVVINYHLDNVPGKRTWPDANKYLKHVESIKDDIVSGKAKLPIRGVFAEDFGFTADDVEKGYIYVYNRLYDENSELLNKMKSLFGMLSIQHQLKPSTNKTESDMSNAKTEQLLKQIVKDNPGLMNKIGNIPGEFRSLLENILTPRPPVINWKDYLRKYISKSMYYIIKSTRIKPNKRMEDLATIKMYDKLSLFISVDTSGSMSDDDIKECFTEINHIFKLGNTTTVGECDAKLSKTDIYEYKGKYPTTRKGLSGGGGTDMTDCIVHANDNCTKYTCHVHITDGYIPKPSVKHKLPTIIIITPNGENVETIRDMGFSNVIKMNKK